MFDTIYRSENVLLFFISLYRRHQPSNDKNKSDPKPTWKITAIEPIYSYKSMLNTLTRRYSLTRSRPHDGTLIWASCKYAISNKSAAALYYMVTFLDASFSVHMYAHTVWLRCISEHMAPFPSGEIWRVLVTRPSLFNIVLFDSIKLYLI